MSLNPIDYYDADKWDIPNEDRGVEQRERKAMSEIIKAVDGKKASILDIGCGDGLFLEALYAKIPESNRKKLKLFGVDYSHYKLKKAKKLKQPFTFDWCNLEERIPHKDGQFDVVHSGEVIEHIYNPDFMLEECRRVLKKDGLLIISTPNLINWYNRVLFLFGLQPLF
jgi:2-polyprenyl-3-methyl-5-hydroxy-6-metoxy-1,4-benzoquinol methylase